MENSPKRGLQKIKDLQKIPQWPQKSIEWLKQRKGKLTSSDSATALGINPYETPEKLFFKKCGISEPFTGNEATKHGERYESEAIDIYCKIMNKKNYEFGLISYDDISERKEHYDIPYSLSFLAGSPDGVAIDLDDSEDEILLEIKCPIRRKIIPGYVPAYYYSQVQLNLEIADIDKADYVEYIPAGISPFFLREPVLNIVRVHRDRQWFLENSYKMYMFWTAVILWKKHGIENHNRYPFYAKKLGLEIKEQTNENNSQIIKK